METNIKVLGWLYIVLGVLGVLLGAFILVFLLSIGVVADDREAMGILFIVGMFVGAVMTVVSAPGIFVGFGLLNFKSWARVFALVLGILNLPGFPMGTVLGVYTLISLLTEDAAVLFAEH